MHKVLVFGSNGLLGSQFAKQLTKSDKYELLAPSRDLVDLCSEVQVREYITEHKPDYIINCAGYNLVDQCEIDEQQQEMAMNLNVKAPEMLAKLALEQNARFITFSTDYVFDGSKESPYLETDETNPINYYGQTKLMAEKAVAAINPQALIIRTQWLFGPGRRDFIDAILPKLENAEPVPVVNDQVGCPTYTVDLTINVIENFLNSDLSGVIHLVNQGAVSWYEYTLAVQEVLGTNAHVVPVDSGGFKRLATRPKNSILSSVKVKPMRAFKEALQEYLLK
jgi:dTDP-4-dehydrorhamnose reductase